MSAFLSVSSLSLRTPDHRPLVEDLTLSFGAEVTGLVGPNGAGKSTLLSALAGQLRPASGGVQRIGSVGWLRQLGPDADGVIADGLGAAEGLERLARITAGDGDEADFDAADWTLESRADAALARMGLDGFALDHPLAALSGGQRARVALAAAWLAAPDLLLMDEPTNNLDAEGRALVHAMMRDWSGGILVASHDRALLDQVDRILALNGPGWSVFGGGWSDYAAARDAERARISADLNRAEAALKQTRRAAQEAEARRARRARVGKALGADGSQPKMVINAKKSQSEGTAARLSGLAQKREAEAQTRVSALEARHHRGPRLNVKAVAGETPQGRVLLQFEAVSFGYGADPVINALSLTVSGGDRLAIEGRNGAGKTTVLKLAEGALAPQSGAIRRGAGRIARLDQTVSDLDPSLSAVDAVRARTPSLSKNAAYAALAQFDLRNRDADKPVHVLSGGERLRVGLAAVLGGEPPALILLDEPTNHLDLDAIEALEAALRAFDGAIMAVSHDPAFLEAIGVDQRLSL